MTSNDGSAAGPRIGGSQSPASEIRGGDPRHRPADPPLPMIAGFPGQFDTGAWRPLAPAHLAGDRRNAGRPRR
jgi:hypothetical protein